MAGTDFVADFAASPQTIDFNGGTSHTSLAPGASIVVRLQAQVRNDVGSGATLTNPADVDWASKDGAPADSRVYDDGPRETNYTARHELRVEHPPGRPRSPRSVTPATARIGETLTYTCASRCRPRRSPISPDLTDAIATDGLRYVPGSAAISDVSGDPQTAAVLAGVTEDTSARSGLDPDLRSAVAHRQRRPSHPTGDTDYVFDLTFQMQVTGKDRSRAPGCGTRPPGRPLRRHGDVRLERRSGPAQLAGERDRDDRDNPSSTIDQEFQRRTRPSRRPRPSTAPS